jgi:hypothetical protein
MDRLLCGTLEPVVWMLRENSKRMSRELESINAEHRDGSVRSSVEGSVMELERRG